MYAALIGSRGSEAGTPCSTSCSEPCDRAFVLCLRLQDNQERYCTNC